MIATDIVIAAADHPSLDDTVDDLLLELRAEPRYFGPAADPDADTSLPALVDDLGRPGAIRLVALACDRVVGIARVDEGGDVVLAVGRGHRNRGIGTALLAATIHRAEQVGFTRLVLSAAHRSPAVCRAADRVGAIAVDHGDGRLDLIVPVGVPDRTTA